MDIPVIAETPAETEGYVPASDGKIKSRLRAVTSVAADDVAAAVAHIAASFDKTELPDTVSSVRVEIGLTVSGEFGVGIAGAGVNADVKVEFEWQK